MYLKISAKKKAEIGQCAAEHRVLAMVRYYATKLPVPVSVPHVYAVHPAGNSLVWAWHS